MWIKSQDKNCLYKSGKISVDDQALMCSLEVDPTKKEYYVLGGYPLKEEALKEVRKEDNYVCNHWCCKGF